MGAAPGCQLRSLSFALHPGGINPSRNWEGPDEGGGYRAWRCFLQACKLRTAMDALQTLRAAAEPKKFDTSGEVHLKIFHSANEEVHHFDMAFVVLSF